MPTALYVVLLFDTAVRMLDCLLPLPPSAVLLFGTLSCFSTYPLL